jgi:hypothetical protein
VAAYYGFVVSGDGAGAAAWGVGPAGGAFGVANDTSLTVLGLLPATDGRAVGELLYSGNAARRNEANAVYSGLNLRPRPFSHPFSVGLSTRPRKRMLPDCRSRTRNRKGRSARNVGVNGTDAGAAASLGIITAVAAAASVPFSLTSTNALCSTLLTYSFSDGS